MSNLLAPPDFAGGWLGSVVRRFDAVSAADTHPGVLPG